MVLRYADQVRYQQSRVHWLTLSHGSLLSLKLSAPVSTPCLETSVLELGLTITAPKSTGQ